MWRLEKRDLSDISSIDCILVTTGEKFYMLYANKASIILGKFWMNNRCFYSNSSDQYH